MGAKFSIDHLGIAVKSLAASKAWYEQLGLRAESEEIVEHEKVRVAKLPVGERDRKSTRLNSSHIQKSRMPSSA